MRKNIREELINLKEKLYKWKIEKNYRKLTFNEVDMLEKLGNRFQDIF